jgi:hypothetical protein
MFCEGPRSALRKYSRSEKARPSKAVPRNQSELRASLSLFFAANLTNINTITVSSLALNTYRQASFRHLQQLQQPTKPHHIAHHASPVPRCLLCAQAPLCPDSSVSLCAPAAYSGSPGQHPCPTSCEPARSSSRRSPAGRARSERW